MRSWIAAASGLGSPTMIAADRISLSADPGELPKAGEGERIEILAAEAVGLLSVGPLLPLEEAGRRDERAALLRTPRGKAPSRAPSRRGR